VNEHFLLCASAIERFDHGQVTEADGASCQRLATVLETVVAMDSMFQKWNMRATTRKSEPFG
jgi:hypothetical protein